MSSSSSDTGERKIMNFDRKFTDETNSPIDYSKMEATESTKFSSDLPYHVYQLVDIIGKVNPEFVDKTQCKNILDCTGHVGSFALCWAALFRKHKVTAVEIDEFTFTRLQNNTKNLGLDDQVTVINLDVTKFINVENQYDFVYMDPPWGGPNYKFKKGIMLYLGSKSVVEFILDIFYKKVTKYVFVKLPLNFDFQSLPFKYTVYNVMSKHRGKSFPDYLVACITKIDPVDDN